MSTGFSTGPLQSSNREGTKTITDLHFCARVFLKIF
jgi:hypothetical protein